MAFLYREKFKKIRNNLEDRTIETLNIVNKLAPVCLQDLLHVKKF